MVEEEEVKVEVGKKKKNKRRVRIGTRITSIETLIFISTKSRSHVHDIRLMSIVAVSGRADGEQGPDSAVCSFSAVVDIEFVVVMWQAKERQGL